HRPIPYLSLFFFLHATPPPAISSFSLHDALPISPRMAETSSGMLNSIGLQGPGIDAFLQRDLPWLLSRGARAVVSIAGNTVEEYAELAARLSDAAGVTALEVNISCPNVEHRGQVFACDAADAGAVIAAVRARTRYD